MEIKQHLKEIRKRLLYIVVPTTIVFMVFLAFSSTLGSSLVNYFGLSENLVSLNPTENISSMLNLSFAFSFMFFIPLFIYNIFMFCKEVIPNQYQNKIKTYSLIGFVLGCGGFLFGSTIISKVVFEGLKGYGFVENMWSINSVLSLAGIFGGAIALGLQLFWFMPFMINTKILERETITKVRPIFILIVLIVSALITPPDVISQLILALPIIFSYEGGLFISKLKGGKKC